MPPEVPAHLAPGLNRWIRDGIMPGGFLRAVLSNDLRTAVAAGDPTSVEALPDIVRWLEERAPPDCWGSAEAVQRWGAHRRAVQQLALANDPTLDRPEDYE